MKLTAILVPLIALGVLGQLLVLPWAADAATGSLVRRGNSRSSKQNGKEDEDQKTKLLTTGNVTRGGNAGNVRSSTTSTVRKVTRSTSSTERTSKVTTTNPATVSRTKRIVTTGEIRRTTPSERQPTASHIPTSRTSTRATSTSSHIRSGDGRGGPSNVWTDYTPRPPRDESRRSEGNVSNLAGNLIRDPSIARNLARTTRTIGYAKPSYDQRRDTSRRDQTHDDHGVIYDRDKYSIYRHRDDDGEYRHHRRWRDRDRDRHDVWYYDRWVGVDDYYYVRRLTPPWARTTTVVTYVPEVVERVVVIQSREVEEQVPAVIQEPETGPQYENYLTRQEVRDPLAAVELPLTPLEVGRVNTLIALGLIDGLIKQGDVYDEHAYTLDARGGTLTITAPSEHVAIIETMVRDERTYAAVSRPSPFGHSAGVIALVSPYFLQEDYQGALRLASANFEAVRKMLQERDPNYAYFHKECWLNVEYGTATFVDEREALADIQTLVATQPVIPVQLIDLDEPAEAQ